MSVDAISFSAHADFPQTSEFVGALQPPHVVFVHGEATNMQRLRDALAAQARVTCVNLLTDVADGRASFVGLGRPF